MTSDRPQPPPYLFRLAEYLRDQDPDVWKWFADGEARREQAEAVRLELLKNCYRIEPGSKSRLYELANEVAKRLAVAANVTIYQAQTGESLNASLCYIPTEVHLVLHGSVLARLDEDQLQALIGHELSHFALWSGYDGQFQIADRLLAALALDDSAAASHLASARLFQLYSEVFCDRGAWYVTGALNPVVETLVKMSTGLNDVSAESYLRQAAEIFAQDRSATKQPTHPEAYMRTRAIQLWSQKQAAAEDQVAELIEGPLRLAELDLLQQEQVQRLTRLLIDRLLRPEWFRTEAIQAHAQHFFHDYQFVPCADGVETQLADAMVGCDEALLDYFSFVLLDFVTVDRTLEEHPLAAALELAEQVGLHERFSQRARTELRLRKKQLARIDAERNELLDRIAVKTKNRDTADKF